MPLLPDELNHTFAPQKYLSGSDAVLPLFPKVPTIDDTIYRVVTKVRMDALYRGVKFNRSHEATPEQEQNSVRENSMIRPSRSAGAQYVVVNLSKPSVKLAADARPRLAFRSRTHLTELFDDRRKTEKLILENRRSERGKLEYVVANSLNSGGI
ncbi:hypothetical protein RAS1_26550 [Phycisphaerae bacterium RAS1]|nr:hypothetical protein RAS1_26550 [Phycisphaerae bacterium RAS1]